MANPARLSLKNFLLIENLNPLKESQKVQFSRFYKDKLELGICCISTSILNKKTSKKALNFQVRILF